MPLSVPFDYHLRGSSADGRRVRIHRVRHKSNVSEKDYEAFAVSLWTLSQAGDATVSTILKDQESVSVSERGEVAFESPPDIDRGQVCAVVGKERLLGLAQVLGDSALALWFRQEADILEDQPNKSLQPTPVDRGG